MRMVLADMLSLYLAYAAFESCSNISSYYVLCLLSVGVYLTILFWMMMMVMMMMVFNICIVYFVLLEIKPPDRTNETSLLIYW